MISLFLLSYHKSGTSWFDAIGRKLAAEAGMGFEVLRHGDTEAETSRQLNRLNDADGPLICRAGYFFSQYQHLLEFPTLRLVRDPRDMVVSGYFSHLHSHGDLGKNYLHKTWSLQEIHDALSALGQSDGLLREIQFFDGMFRDMEAWDNVAPGHVDLRYEDLLSGAAALTECLMSLGCCPAPFSAEAVEKCYNDATFARLTGGRIRGQEDLNSHYRKGVSGDWRNYFAADHTEAMKKTANSLLLKLGYEQTSEW